MKTVVIGGTGHIGSSLVSQLVGEGYDMISLSSGRNVTERDTFGGKVEYVGLSYDAMLSEGSFQALLTKERPDAVVDILQGDACGVYSACKQAGVGQLVFCGSLWMFGRAKVVPTPEVRQTDCPFESYAKRYSELLEVLEISREGDVAVCGMMEPNICGPGKVPLDGKGGRSIEVHREHQQGMEICLPYPGTNLVGPCDVYDVAHGFVCALKNREASAGELFNVGSAYALTSEQFINTYADIYGKPIPIRYVDPREYERDILPDLGANFHFLENMCPDISRISSRLGYKPKYTPKASMERAVKWMRDKCLL